MVDRTPSPAFFIFCISVLAKDKTFAANLKKKYIINVSFSFFLHLIEIASVSRLDDIRTWLATHGRESQVS
ncbi:MAG: hypothetical protein GX416_10730 [Bacteroidales bacterium]|nr:hypothetical protein [Bacteroidales bacterium]